MDKGSGFIDKVFKIFQVDFSANEKKVDLMCVFSPCKIAGDISFLNGSQVPEHLIDDLVKTYILTKNIVNVGKKGMVGIGFKDLSVLFFP